MLIKFLKNFLSLKSTPDLVNLTWPDMVNLVQRLLNTTVAKRLMAKFACEWALRWWSFFAKINSWCRCHLWWLMVIITIKFMCKMQDFVGQVIMRMLVLIGLVLTVIATSRTHPLIMSPALDSNFIRWLSSLSLVRDHNSRLRLAPLPWSPGQVVNNFDDGTLNAAYSVLFQY